MPDLKNKMKEIASKSMTGAARFAEAATEQAQFSAHITRLWLEKTRHERALQEQIHLMGEKIYRKVVKQGVRGVRSDAEIRKVVDEIQKLDKKRMSLASELKLVAKRNRRYKELIRSYDELAHNVHNHIGHGVKSAKKELDKSFKSIRQGMGRFTHLHSKDLDKVGKFMKDELDKTAHHLGKLSHGALGKKVKQQGTAFMANWAGRVKRWASSLENKLK